MTSDTSRPSTPEIAAPAIEHEPRGASASTQVSGAVAVARRTAKVARDGGAKLIALAPGTLRTTGSRAQEAANALQAMPDPTLRTMAASSLGLGAGFYLRGAPRLIVVAGLVPALLMGAAIALRPVAPAVPNGIDR